MNSMKRILLYLLLCLSISATAHVSRTAIFDFADPTNLNPSVTPSSEIGADVEITGTTFTNKPKSVIRISLCRTAKRNPNDRFGLNNDSRMIAPSAGLVIILMGKMWPYGEYRQHHIPEFLSVNLLISLIVGAGESNDGLVKVCAFSLFFYAWLRKTAAYGGHRASISGGFFARLW